MELQRIGMKMFCREGDSIPLVEFIPIFHRWIQEGLTDTLLIDVADYSHVVDGPGILLAAGEGNFGLDENRGRRGLVYYQKTDQGGGPDARLAGICKRVVQACKQLESEPELAGRLSFDTAEIEIFSNDRLHGPNTPQGYEQVEPHVVGLLSRLYGDGGATVEREQDSRERLAFYAKAANAGLTLEGLHEKLGG